MITEFTGDDQPNAYSGFILVHDSEKSIHLRLTDVPDEAVPELCLFAELDLVGIITGEGIYLHLSVVNLTLLALQTTLSKCASRGSTLRSTRAR